MPEPDSVLQKPEPTKKADDDTDHETWLSDESSSEEGYQVKWFQKNGYWYSEKVPIGADFSEYSESTEFYSSESSGNSYDERGYDETGYSYNETREVDWRWVKSGRRWAKEYVSEASLFEDASPFSLAWLLLLLLSGGEAEPDSGEACSSGLISKWL